MSRKCYLKCLIQSHPPIPLPHNVETPIGRSKLTRIKDQSCSRQQLICKANCDDCTVEIKQMGHNPSGLDGFALKKGESYTVRHGSRLEILLNQYIHLIDFEPSPEDFDQPKLSLKRKRDEKEMPKNNKMKFDQDTVDNKLIASPAEANVWEEMDKGDLYIFTSKGVISSTKIAAFDMDGTLITTKSGKVFPIDTNDWKLLMSSIPQKLQQLIDDGFKIVILSNQSPIKTGKVKIEDFKKKVEDVVEKLQVPIQAYLAADKHFYRKPLTGMWKVLSEKKNDGLKINMDVSFYCGDAAGRQANWAPGKKKDHSMADRLLAENLGLNFFTPEQYFLGHSIANVPMREPDFSPKKLKPEPFNENLISNSKEILVFVGYPGSGKSFLAKQIEKKSSHQYVAVCRDVLGSWQKCAAEAARLLERGKSVIVDSTNPDIESRKRWTDLAKQMKVECRCAKMATTKAHSMHNNKFREIMKTDHAPVNDIVFHTYKNKFVEPTVSEGFKEIIEVKFSPSFDNKETENLYMMHLLEK